MCIKLLQMVSQRPSKVIAAMEALITATAASLFVTLSAILNKNLIHPRK